MIGFGEGVFTVEPRHAELGLKAIGKIDYNGWFTFFLYSAAIVNGIF